jgi:hypothetical protein
MQKRYANTYSEPYLIRLGGPEKFHPFDTHKYLRASMGGCSGTAWRILGRAWRWSRFDARSGSDYPVYRKEILGSTGTNESYISINKDFIVGFGMN